MPLLRSNVLEWVQPTPTVTSGEAAFTITGLADTVVSGIALALANVGTQFSVAVPTVGVAPATIPALVLESAPLAGARATVVLDGTGSTARNVREVACIALADIGSSVFDLQVVGSGIAGVLVLARGFAAVPQLGSATVAMEYYGDGSVPIFPYKLPILFLPIDFSNLSAAAEIELEGSSAPSVAGETVAFVSMLGETALIRFGSTPLFPFEFPIVFSDGVFRRSEAVVSIDGQSESLVEVLGDASAAISAPADRLNISVFSMVFPFVFFSLAG